jgi:hypothetical protein
MLPRALERYNNSFIPDRRMFRMGMSPPSMYFFAAYITSEPLFLPPIYIYIYIYIYQEATSLKPDFRIKRGGKTKAPATYLDI